MNRCLEATPGWWGLLPSSARAVLPGLVRRAYKERIPWTAVAQQLELAVTERPLHPGEALNWLRAWTHQYVNLLLLQDFVASQGQVQAVRFMAVSSATCSGRDGLVLGLEDPLLLCNVPPLHWGCRSLLMPVTRFELESCGGPQRLQSDRACWEDAPPPAPGFGAPQDLEATLRWMQRSMPRSLWGPRGRPD